MPKIKFREPEQMPKLKGVQRRLLGTQDQSSVDASARCITYIFSDESVARDGHTISTEGWQLENFKANPVFLWCHDSHSPPIGKVIDVQSRGGQLVGTVQYADEETYEFADTIYRLTVGGYLNAVSVSWDPVDWKWSKDKARPGGIDFISQELLEVSAVPVPALPSALATARAAGINTEPLYRWAEKILDTGEMILMPRREIELLRKGAKPEVPSRTQEENKMTEVKKSIKTKRGLYQVAGLASILSDLNYLKSSVDYEAEMEKDNSEVPQQLADALKALGQTLISMTVEEVAEMLADADDADAGPSRKSQLQFIRLLDDSVLSCLSSLAQKHRAGEKIMISIGESNFPFPRAGKSLSGKNQSTLEGLHRDATALTEHIRSFIDDNSDEEEDDNAGDADNEDPEKTPQLVSLDNEIERKSKTDLRSRLAKAARARHLFDSGELSAKSSSV